MGNSNYKETFWNTPLAQHMPACILLLLYNNSNAYNVSTLTEFMSLNPPTTPQLVYSIRKLRLNVNTVSKVTQSVNPKNQDLNSGSLIKSPVVPS